MLNALKVHLNRTKKKQKTTTCSVMFPDLRGRLKCLLPARVLRCLLVVWTDWLPATGDCRLPHTSSRKSAPLRANKTRGQIHSLWPQVQLSNTTRRHFRGVVGERHPRPFYKLRNAFKARMWWYIYNNRGLEFSWAWRERGHFVISLIGRQNMWLDCVVPLPSAKLRLGQL